MIAAAPMPVIALEQHVPGHAYDVAKHGVVIRPASYWDALYKNEQAKFSRFWETNGFPVDCHVPAEVWHLVSEAYANDSVSNADRRAGLLAQAKLARFIVAVR